jgi:hypothetical protein
MASIYEEITENIHMNATSKMSIAAAETPHISGPTPKEFRQIMRVMAGGMLKVAAKNAHISKRNGDETDSVAAMTAIPPKTTTVTETTALFRRVLMLA